MLLSRVGWGTEEVKRSDRKSSVYKKHYSTAGVGYN